MFSYLLFLLETVNLIVFYNATKLYSTTVFLNILSHLLITPSIIPLRSLFYSGHRSDVGCD